MPKASKVYYDFSDKFLSKVDHPEMLSNVVEILKRRTLNSDTHFFLIMVIYYYATIASNLRASLKLEESDSLIPLNVYMMSLGLSGTNKTRASKLMKDEVLGKFYENFMVNCFAQAKDEAVTTRAKQLLRTQEYIARGSQAPELALEAARKEMKSLGEYPMVFDTATIPALKQLRVLLLKAKAGSLNSIIDEIGSNILANKDLFKVYLELWDNGTVEDGLIKNTAEQIRIPVPKGGTPSNLLMFGTQTKVFDGGPVEAEMYSLYEAGFGRRCFYGYTEKIEDITSLTPETIYDSIVNTDDTETFTKLRKLFGKMGKKKFMHKSIECKKDMRLMNIAYMLHNKRKAQKLPSDGVAGIIKTELDHRHFKVLKLAALYAFLEGSLFIKERHQYAAIKFAEESGKRLKLLLKREPLHVRLLNYMAAQDGRLTTADLVQNVPYFKGSIAQKKEMLTMSMEHAYKHNVSFTVHRGDNNIDFYEVKKLETTNLKKLIISYSNDITKDYINRTIKFNQLKMLAKSDINWVNHHLQAGYRAEENIVQGFNTVVFDIDKHVSIQQVQILMEDYTYFIHTTKSHTKKKNRFRIIFPISHKLYLKKKAYKQFMANIMHWLPFSVDNVTGQRSRKWAANRGISKKNKGNLMDVNMFIPKSTKAREVKNAFDALKDSSHLEAWFIVNTTTDTNRNNNLYRYGAMFKGELSKTEIKYRVSELNSRLSDPLTSKELDDTIFTSLFK